MAEFLSQFRSIDIVNYVGVEDFADRLNFLFTPTLLGALCTMVTVRTYFLHPISCYLPNQFGATGDSGQMNFVNNYCWTEGTYAVNPKDFKLDMTLEDGGLGRYKKQKIVYYQWIPFALGMQAVLFCLPRLLWHMFSYDRAGTDVAHIVKIARDAARETGENREKLIGHACRMLQQMINRNLSRSDTCGQPGSLGHLCCRCTNSLLPSRLIGNWLILTYFLVKLAYLANTIGQLALMQGFLQLNSTRYSLLGMNLLADVVAGEDWQNTMVFPRVGCCAVYMRSAGEGNWQFSQCSLPINMINEKIYIFLWFWFISVALVTAFSIVMWSLRLFNSGIKGSFITKYLKLADNYSQLKKNVFVNKFLRRYLRHDCTFVLKMIALNCGDIVCSEILKSLWADYKNKCIQQMEAGSGGGRGQGKFCHRRQSSTLTPCMKSGVLRLSCNNLPNVTASPKGKMKGKALRLLRLASEPAPATPPSPTLLPQPEPSAPGCDTLEAIDEIAASSGDCGSAAKSLCKDAAVFYKA